MPRGRPKKYFTEKQRIIAKKVTDKRAQSKVKRIAGRYFRLVIPALTGYSTDWTWQTKAIIELKQQIVDTLCAKQHLRGLQQYLVAIQRHPGSGKPHLDMLLIYRKQVKNSLAHYDYLLKHGHLTRYRSVNAAILDYGRKQDPQPLGNLDTARVITQSRVKTQLYVMMQAAMLKDPFEFHPIDWLINNNLMASASRTNVYKTIRLVKDRQNRECNRQLTERPGFREITPQLIAQCLTAQQLETYRSWPGYQVIVDHLNQICQYRCQRPHKMPHLLIVGRPNTGKTRLALQIEKCLAVYYKGVSNWFPAYRSGVYPMVLWNEFNLKSMPYPDLLNFLEGAKMDLQYKGGSVLKTDNQLIYMTSNMSLDMHIRARFSSLANRELARANLRARITEVVIPDNVDLFVLLKLVVAI